LIFTDKVIINSVPHQGHSLTSCLLKGKISSTHLRTTRGKIPNKGREKKQKKEVYGEKVRYYPHFTVQKSALGKSQALLGRESKNKRERPAQRKRARIVVLQGAHSIARRVKDVDHQLRKEEVKK